MKAVICHIILLFLVSSCSDTSNIVWVPDAPPKDDSTSLDQEFTLEDLKEPDKLPEFLKYCVSIAPSESSSKKNVPLTATLQTFNALLINTSENTVNHATCLNAYNQLRNKTSLSLNAQNLSELKLLTSFTNLKHLELSENPGLRGKLNPLKTLTHLESLDISGIKIESLDFLSHLTKLKNLFLSDAEMTDLSLLGKVSSLTHLEYENYPLKDLQALSLLTGLTTLKLNHGAFETLRGIGSLTNLKYLSLRESYYLKNVKEIDFLGELVELDLFRDPVTKGSYPSPSLNDLDSVSKLFKLEKLDLSFHSLTDLSFVAKLVNLKELYISGNSFVDFPQAIVNLAHLEALDFNCNKCTTKPEDLDIPSIYNEGNFPYNLDPPSLSKLKNLRYLSLDRNGIRSIDFLKDNVNLEELSLNSNLIKTLEPLQKLERLRSLEVAGTIFLKNHDLRYLPNRDFFYRLNLSSTMLEDFSPLASLRGIQKLELEGNRDIDFSSLSGIKVEELNLMTTSLTDADLKTLQDNGVLNYTKKFYLRFTDITQIKILMQLSSLEVLNIRNTPLSDGNIIALKRALPYTEIINDPLTIQEPLEPLGVPEGSPVTSAGPSEEDIRHNIEAYHFKFSDQLVGIGTNKYRYHIDWNWNPPPSDRVLRKGFTFWILTNKVAGFQFILPEASVHQASSPKLYLEKGKSYKFEIRLGLTKTIVETILSRKGSIFEARKTSKLVRTIVIDLRENRDKPIEVFSYPLNAKESYLLPFSDIRPVP